MIEEIEEKRDLRYQHQHDAIYASLDLIPDWTVYGHLSFKENCQGHEAKRLKKFHLLMRDLAKRFTKVRDLDGTGWFLKQEGHRNGKRFHFHFAITNDNLQDTTPETVCRYLNNQWRKIGQSVCEIGPWDSSRTAKGIWYLTQNDQKPLEPSAYFQGEFCHWKMSKLLHSRILNIANQNEHYEN